MISLDKYDKQNMPKFERLLRKDVAVQYRLKPYDFVSPGETERRQGINLELVSIRQVREKGKEVREKTANEAAPPHSVKLVAAEESPPAEPRVVRRRRTPVTAEQGGASFGGEEQMEKLEEQAAAE